MGKNFFNRKEVSLSKQRKIRAEEKRLKLAKDFN